MIQSATQAGPSNYQHQHRASTSSSSLTRHEPTSPTAHPRPTHVQAIHDFSPSLLSSANIAANPNMYLGFKSGEIIRVHTRDASGWWDGEIGAVNVAVDGPRDGPRRGWFPSNYVREMGLEGSSHRANGSTSKTESTTSPRSRPASVSQSNGHGKKDSVANTVHSRQTSTTSHASRHSTASTSYNASPKHRSMASLPTGLQELLHPVVQALSLLESAIHSNHKTHIQPSTAHIISAIRAALTQTDCIHKDSKILAAAPALAKERKVILLELSRLVHVAKTVSAPTDDGAAKSKEDELKDMEVLAKAARAVFATTKRFLQLAKDAGIEPTPLDDVTRKALNLGDMLLPANRSKDDAGTGSSMKQPRTRETSSGNARIQETFKMKAKSIGDLRAAHKRAASPPPPLPTAGLLTNGHVPVSGRTRSPSNASTPMSSTFASSSGSGRSSPVSMRSARNRKLMGSIDSTSTHSQSPMTEFGSRPWEDSTPMPTPANTITNRSTSGMVDIEDEIELAEEDLLSRIAAFIGHIHSHQIVSHPSSHAVLIEMTQETIGCVRELLTVVEAVGRHPGIRAYKPRETETLRTAKDNLYEVASKLVEHAETIANAPFSEVDDAEFEEVKKGLLWAATKTLRTGKECARLVRLCVQDGHDQLSATATPRPPDAASRLLDAAGRQSTPRPPGHDAAVILRDKIVGQRGVHTLSGLHRKASSLSLLQKRYQDGHVLPSPIEDDGQEDTEEDDEEVVEDAAKDEDLTMKLVPPLQKPFPKAPIRPLLIHTHTSPSIRGDGPRSADLLRTFPDDQAHHPRSRSSSLTSPAPPHRLTHRSPSRSADLDKFTSDYDLPMIPRKSSSPLATQPVVDTSTLHPPGQHSPANNDTLTPPHILQTPVAERRSSYAGHLSRPPEQDGSNLTVTHVRSQLLARPAAPMRSFTAPMPMANNDINYWVLAHDYDPREITFNPDGNMVGASLRVLVEKMTPHDGPVEQTYWTSFFYTFRLYTTPLELATAIMARYDLQPPHALEFSEKDMGVWIESKVVPVRLRIYNFLRAWLDLHWRSPIDDVALEPLKSFTMEVVAKTLPAMAPRLLDAISKHLDPSANRERALKRLSSTDRLHRGVTLSTPPTHGGLPPTPQISKSLNSLLQKNPASTSVLITDFDTLELARQLTIMESKLFCAVAPEDLLQTGKKSIPELRALSALSNHITGWVADNILNELDAKKRATLLKFYIKLADKCFNLNNFSTMFAVLAGLNSSIVLRLKKTWDALSSKYRIVMDRLQSVIEHTKNHAAYRARLREVEGPCLPFLGLILTDITFTSEGNADTRPSTLSPDLQLVNQDKYAKLGKIAIDFARYQEPFIFHELEVVQNFLKRALAERGSTSLDALYSKSLMLEPRQGSEKITSAVEKPGWLGGKI